jgi:hypothetical protein
MVVPAKIMKEWIRRRSRGDVANLTRFTNLSKPTIIKAVNHGTASEDIILNICRYYSQKITLTVKEIENQGLTLLNCNDGKEPKNN